MNAEQDRVRTLAERIANRISQHADEAGQVARNSSGAAPDELTDLRESLAELKRKLASIEEHLSQEQKEAAYEKRAASAQGKGRPATVIDDEERDAARPPASAHSPWLSGMYVPAAHPSQEKFGVEEAAVSELVDFFEKEKVCELEPGGKPCTHCDMCSTRGF